MPRAEELTFNLGRLAVEGKQSRFELRCDRLAINEYNAVYLASVVGDSRSVKAFGAFLNSRKGDGTHTLKGDGFECVRPRSGRADDHQSKYINRDTLYRVEGGYRRRTTGLDYGMSHALFVSRHDGFLPWADDEALWDLLKSNRYTTPMLPHWVPFIRKVLLRERLLDELWGHRCRCMILRAKTEDLDKAVKEGFRTGAFTADFYPSASATA
jgi:hypothetical protein